MTPLGIVAAAAIVITIAATSYGLGRAASHDVGWGEPSPPITEVVPAASRSSSAATARGAVAALLASAAPSLGEPARLVQPPAPPPVEIVKELPTSGFGLQLGAFPTEEEARAFVEAHAEALSGRAVYLVPTEIADRGTWHRVRIGVAKQRQEAEAMRRKLPKELAAGSIVVSHR